MKVNYKFIKALQKFFTSKDWSVNLRNRVIEINKELEISPKQNLENKIQNAELKNSKNKNWSVDNAFGEVIRNNIIKSHEKKLEKLLQEKAKLETCLDSNTYMLGITPFEDVNNTKLLLANAHILELKSTSMIFNQEAISAVKNMFTENFHKLYDLKVSNIASNNVGYPPEQKFILFMNKIIEGKELELEDIYQAFDPLGELEEVDPEIIINQDLNISASNSNSNSSQLLALNNRITLNEEVIVDKEKIDIENQNNEYKKLAPKLLSLFKTVDPELLKYSCNIMYFIKQFYINDVGENFIMLASQLAFYLSETDDIDRFLEKEVNFESFQTIGNSIALIGLEFFGANEISLSEIKAWRVINGEFGREAIKLFAKSEDLKLAGFDICNLKQTNTTEECFKKAQEISKTLKYEDEDSHKELAKLMHKYNYPAKIFNKVVKEILPYQKNYDLIPDISFTINLPKNEGFSFSKLKPGALEGLFLGKMSYSCQSIGGEGEKCAIDGFTREDAGFYAIRNMKNEIIAQFYAWLGKNQNGKVVLVLDSYEYVPISAHKNLFISTVKKLESEIKNFGFSELYVGCGGRTPKLTSEQFYNVIKPKYKTLYQYSDSKSVYKITQKVSLKEDDDNGIVIEYKDFTEFYAKNLVLNCMKIFGNNQDFDDDDYHLLTHTINNSKLVRYFIQEHIISLEVINQLLNNFYGFLLDTHPISSEIRIKFIDEILMTANGNNEIIFKMIRLVDGIHPSLIEILSIQELIKFCNSLYNIPMIISSNAHLNGFNNVVQKIALEVTKLGFEKFGVENIKLEKILNNLSNIDSRLIAKLTIEETLELCNSFDYIPAIIFRYSHLNILDSEIQEIIFKVVIFGLNKFGAESKEMDKFFKNLSISKYEYIKICPFEIIFSEVFSKICTIHLELLKIIKFEELIELCSKLEYIPAIISSFASESQLKFVLKTHEKSKSDISLFAETCIKLSSINSSMLDFFDPDLLVKFLNKVKDVPFGIIISDEKISFEKYKNFVSTIFNNYNDNSTLSRILNSVSELSPEIFNEVENFKLIELLAESSRMPYILSKYSSIDPNKQLELVKKVFEFSPDIIIEICNNKICYYSDILEVEQIEIFAQELHEKTVEDKELLGGSVIYEN